MQKIYIILKDITEFGGGERVCVNLANAFSESGLQVSVISFFRFQNEIPFALNENVNIRFLSHTTPKSKNPFKKLFNKSIYRYVLSKKVDKTAQQEKPDIILANDGYYIPTAKLNSIQYIRLWHLNAPKKIDKRKQKIFNLFDTLVVLSPRELDIWQNYHKNIKVIPNFLPYISEKNTDSNQHRIISVGRMDNGDQKGFLRLIDIWEKVQEIVGGLRGLGRKNDEMLESNHAEYSDSKQTSAEAVCDDFKSCERFRARSYLSGSAEARKANSLKRAETATHKKDLESWELIIVGDGAMKEQIQAKILEKNLQDTIILKPFTKDIEKEYLNASIYAMTSHFEGFGMVLAEASSYALPCLAFDIAAGPSDIIESNVSGYLINDNDLQGYADKLIELMSDKEKRESMGLKAKQKVGTTFSKEAIIELWQEIF